LKVPAGRKKALILGLGNPLSGDDCFGAQVLELLNRDRLPPDVVLADAHTDLLNHIGNFAEYDCVVLVDAILDPEGRIGRPGCVLVLQEEALLSLPETSQGAHQLSPLLALKLFRAMHPEARVQISLVGLLVNRIDLAPRYVTSESINEGASAVRALFGRWPF
jgi:hydrogenase maturation protease